jgi:hypothetical protein
VTPSTKYSCSAPPPILENGSTTTDRRGGPGGVGEGVDGFGARKADLDRIDPHLPRDVLERLLAEIDEGRLDLTAHVIIRRARNQHPARLANPLQPCRDIDAFAEDVLALDQYVAEIDADAVDDPLGLGHLVVALGHQLLDCHRAFDGGDHGREFQQQPVAHRLDDAPPEPRHDRPRRLAMLANAERRPRLVLAHQAGITDDIDGHDRGEAAGRGHDSGTPARRRASFIRSNCAMTIGSSVIEAIWARARAMVKDGLSASDAEIAARASSSRPSRASATAN